MDSARSDRRTNRGPRRRRASRHAHALRWADDARTVIGAYSARTVRAARAHDASTCLSDAACDRCRAVARLPHPASAVAWRAVTRRDAAAVGAGRAIGACDAVAGIDATETAATLAERTANVGVAVREAGLRVVARRAGRAAVDRAVTRAEALIVLRLAVRVGRASEVVERDALGDADAAQAPLLRTAGAAGVAAAVEILRSVAGLGSSGKRVGIGVVTIAGRAGGRARARDEAVSIDVDARSAGIAAGSDPRARRCRGEGRSRE